jgi:hypothetical protein
VASGTSRNTLMRNSLIQLARYKDPAIAELPSGNEDVRLVDVMVNGGINSFDFEASGSNILPAAHVSPAGNVANSVKGGASGALHQPVVQTNQQGRVGGRIF